MSRSHSYEGRVCGAINKITNGLATYFKKNVDERCAKLKKAEEEWMNENVEELVSEFKSKTSEQVTRLLENYKLNEKATQLEEARKECLRSRSWRPSGDPTKDIRAHLLQIDEEQAKKLSRLSDELDKIVGKEMSNLESMRRQLRDELVEFQSLSAKLKDVISNFLKTD